MSELATQFGMRECAPPRPARELLDRIPYAFAKRHSLLPLSGHQVAISDPLNLEALEELQLMFGHPVEALYCPLEELMPAIEEAYRTEDKPIEEIEEVEAYDLMTTDETASSIKLANLILSQAIREGASDIHFEPLENELRVRFRIDGILITRHTPSRDLQGQLIARLKVMGRLDIAEHRLPQDGRMKVMIFGRDIDMRISTLPTTCGERIVLRILDRGNIRLGLDELQMPMLDQFRKLIHQTEGIILVTGPTGSGKTTTLYSAISERASDNINIMTIEDPVEYKLPGIAQIGVRPKIGLSFATGLRHILRQDPDVIMVGEIRDHETAEIAIQAALTGHLVLSTLHTNDAPSAITRLVDMGIEPYLLSSSIIGVLAQRLIRTICCSSGCEACLGTGYKGRRAIYELMPVTEAIKTEISKSADSNKLRRAAKGMQTLKEHGAKLVSQGVTTQAEILRVVRN